ncbi:MAG: tetratricopeptide repeat protein, partial [Candidatus Heimdallarchaeota archaeon]|nr:tetratricopeptide repeat protein [Candidatus Heimdallarchaeota archaeon]
MSTYVDQRALENLYTMLYDAINRIIQFPYRDAKFQTQQFLLDSINLFKYEPYNAKPFIKLILQLNSTYQAENKFDEANNLLDEYLEKYKTGEQVQYLMELMEAKLQNHYHAKKIDEAKILVDELISIQKSHENWHGLAKSYNSKGVIYHMNQELEKGLEFYHKAVKVMNTHEITDPQLLDRFYYSLATINYHYLANYEEAEKYYLMGYNIAKEYNNEPRMSFFLDHLGLVNYKKTEYHKALEYHYKAEVYLNTNKTSNDYIFHQLQVSLVYLKIEKYQKSLESLLTVFTNVANTSDGWAVSIPYIILANLIYYSSESIDLNLF